MIGKRGSVRTLVVALDVIGFILMFVGAGLIRFAKEEIVSILGGFVLAGGVTILSVTRLLQK